jgi:hypothetical protein
MALLAQQQTFSPYFSKIDNLATHDVFYDTGHKEYIPREDPAYLIFDIPGYLNPEINDFEGAGARNIKVSRYPGFLINLEDYADCTEFLSESFGKTTRSRFRKYKKRLETCFDISYKIYFGDISRSEYDRLFRSLKVMLERRFDQKKVVNGNIDKLQEYEAAVYPLLLKKKAFIFVIYDGDKPIDIAFNFLFQNTVYSYTSGFDIDYSKFNLGMIDMIKHLEWCFENGYKQMDLLKGDLEYKRRWCNQVYSYKYMFVYKSGSLSGFMQARYKALVKGLIPQVLLKLKGYNLHLIKKKIQRLRFKKYREQPEVPVYLIRPVPAPEKYPRVQLEEIGIEDTGACFPRRLLYDYLYSNPQPLSGLRFYQSSDPGSYLVKAGGEMLEIIPQQQCENPVS